jgi:hypothetical protein
MMRQRLDPPFLKLLYVTVKIERLEWTTSLTDGIDSVKIRLEGSIRATPWCVRRSY